MNSNAGSLPSTLQIESMNTSKQMGAEHPGKDFCTGKKSSLCLPLMSRAGSSSKQKFSAYSQTQFQQGLQRQWLVVKGKKKESWRLSAGVARPPNECNTVCTLLMLNVYTTFGCRRKQRQKISAWQKHQWHWSLVTFLAIISMNPFFDAHEWLICWDKS